MDKFIDVLKNFAKFTEKHLCRSLLLNKVAGWKPETIRAGTGDVL